MDRSIWQGMGREHVAGCRGMWQLVVVCGRDGACDRVWGHVAGCGSMWQECWQGVGSFGRVWGHVTGVGACHKG